MKKIELLFLGILVILLACNSNDSCKGHCLPEDAVKSSNLRIPIPMAVAEPCMNKYLTDSLTQQLGLNYEIVFPYQSFKAIFDNSTEPNDTAHFHLVYDSNANTLDFAVMLKSNPNMYALLSGDHIMIPVDQQFYDLQSNYNLQLQNHFLTNSLNVRVDSALSYFNLIESKGDIDSLSFKFAIIDTSVLDSTTPINVVQQYQNSNGHLTRMVVAYSENRKIKDDQSGDPLYFNADDLCPPACGGEK